MQSLKTGKLSSSELNKQIFYWLIKSFKSLMIFLFYSQMAIFTKIQLMDNKSILINNTTGTSHNNKFWNFRDKILDRSVRAPFITQFQKIRLVVSHDSQMQERVNDQFVSGSCVRWARRNFPDQIWQCHEKIEIAFQSWQQNWLKKVQLLDGCQCEV